MFYDCVATLGDDGDQGLVEYAHIIVLVEGAAIGGLKLPSGGVNGAVGSAGSTLCTGF